MPFVDKGRNYKDEGYYPVKVDGEEKCISPQRWDRLKKLAKDLVRKNKTLKDLSEEYDVAYNTLKKDKKLIRDMETDKIRHLTMVEYMAKMLSTKKEVVEEFWNVVEDQKDEDGNPFAKIKALSKIAEMDRQYFKILRDLGFMADRKEKGIDANVIETDSGKSELKERLKDFIDQQDEEEIKEKLSNSGGSNG